MFAQYATIEEAWGPPVTKLTQQLAPVLTPGPLQQPQPDQIRSAISAAFQARGVDGVAGYMDPAVLRAIQGRCPALPGGLFSNLSDDDVLYLMLGLAALLFAMDN